jgi:hypothetical protein
VYLSFALVELVPPAVVTLTSTVPVPAGATAMIWPGVSEVIEVAGVAPNCTAVAPPRLDPVIVTEFVPPVGPAEGDTAVTVGGPPTTLIRVIVSVESVRLKFSAT